MDKVFVEKQSCLACARNGTDFYHGLCNAMTDEEIRSIEKERVNLCYYFKPK